MAKERLKGVIPKEVLKPLILAHLNGRKPDLSTAELIAANTFHGVIDRGGVSYMIHLQQVLLSGSKSDKKIIVGVLHDLVEDTDWTLDDLRQIGFAPDIVDAVDDLTHREGDAYFDSIVRIGRSIQRGDGNNLLSIDTKLADLAHNMSGSRQTTLMTPDQMDKYQAYIVAYNYLVAIKTKDIKPGTSIVAFMEMRPDLKDIALLQKFGNPRSLSVQLAVAFAAQKADLV